METAHLQRVATGKVNVSMTVKIAIRDALGLSSSAFGKYYDDITDEEISDLKKQLAEKKKAKKKGMIFKIAINDNRIRNLNNNELYYLTLVNE